MDTSTKTMCGLLLRYPIKISVLLYRQKVNETKIDTVRDNVLTLCILKTMTKSIFIVLAILIMDNLQIIVTSEMTQLRFIRSINGVLVNEFT